MPITLSCNEWMRRTHSKTRRRSSRLKAIEEAVRIRHEPAGKLIAQSRVEIPGLASARGVYQQTMLDRIKASCKSQGYGRKSGDPDIVEAGVKGEI